MKIILFHNGIITSLKFYSAICCDLSNLGCFCLLGWGGSMLLFLIWYAPTGVSVLKSLEVSHVHMWLPLPRMPRSVELRQWVYMEVTVGLPKVWESTHIPILKRPWSFQLQNWCVCGDFSLQGVVMKKWIWIIGVTATVRYRIGCQDFSMGKQPAPLQRAPQSLHLECQCSYKL